jgi:opacity protein-like surface antigen
VIIAAGRQVVVRLVKVLGAVIIGCACLAPAAVAEDLHPLLSSKYWVKVGGYFASRDSGISAAGTVGIDSESKDWETSTGLDDESDLLMLELGWQFGTKWDFAFQHFRSSRSGRTVLSESIEWEDVVYEVGADIRTHTGFRITRLFFSRRVWDKGPHDFRLGAGVHLLDVDASISGEATLEDGTAEFHESVVSAEFPFPDIGAWYRYSLSDRWMFQSRVDWFSAKVGDYSGGIWNVAAGVDFALTDHLGLGFAYQFFEISGTIREDNWRGELYSRHSGFMLSLDGFW